MYHGLRKALNTTVKQTVKEDARVGTASDAHERLNKGVEALRWTLDNFEAAWTAQSEFCKYLPLVATDIYASEDTAAQEVISNCHEAANALKITASSPVLTPVRSELNSLAERVKKLNAQRTEWLTCISDKAYYDEKYSKIVATNEKNGNRDTEKEKRALQKREQTAARLVKLTSNLADEFDKCHREKLDVTDKIMIAIATAQSSNARRADITSVAEIMKQYRFGARHVPMPRKDDMVAEKLTGVSSRRRSSSDSAPHNSLTTSHSAPIIQESSTQYNASPRFESSSQQVLPTPPAVRPIHTDSTNGSTKSLDIATPNMPTNPYSSQPYGSPPNANSLHPAVSNRPNSTGHRRTHSASSQMYTNSWSSQHDVSGLSNGVNGIEFSAPLDDIHEEEDVGHTPSAPPFTSAPSTNGLFAFKPFARQPL